ncbi:MAG: hypothetical protein WB949_16690 [Candidatus Acidiferrales bacterium]
MKTTRIACHLLAVVGIFLGLSACGGGNNNSQAIVVVINNKLTTIAPGAAAVVLTTTTNDNAGVTFTITANGADCQPGCGTISGATKGSVVYTPPASLPSSPNNQPTIKATSVTDPTKSDADTFTIKASVSNLGLLNGQYAFLVSGFDASGFALGIAGSFTADGAGHITGGELDVNDDGALGSNGSALAGTYTLDENLRGVITITNTITLLAHSPAFSFTLESTGATGDLISLDANEFATSGFLQRQQLVAPAVVKAAAGSSSGRHPNGTVSSSGAPAGSFVFRTTSDDPGIDQVGLVGRFTVNSDGTVSQGLVDAADIFNGNDLTSASATGGSTAPDAVGRGTLTLNITGELGPVKFAYYEVSPQKVYLLEIDAGSSGNVRVLTGEARAQGTLPFAGGAASGTSVFGLIGGDGLDFLTPVPSATIGQLVISGTSATATSDLNDFASTNAGVSSSGTVTFDLNTGRGTITFSGGFNAGFLDSVVFYLESSGQGVMLDTTATNQFTLNEALVGDFVPQTGSSFGNASLNGNFMGVAKIAADPRLPTVVAGLVANDSSLSVTGFGDVGSVNFTPLTNQTLAASYSNINPSTGRGKAVVPALLFGALTGNVNASFYLAGPNKMYLIALDNGNNGAIETSLGIFDPVGTLPSTTARVGGLGSASIPRLAGGVRFRARPDQQPLTRIRTSGRIGHP